MGQEESKTERNDKKVSYVAPSSRFNSIPCPNPSNRLESQARGGDRGTSMPGVNYQQQQTRQTPAQQAAQSATVASSSASSSSSVSKAEVDRLLQQQKEQYEKKLKEVQIKNAVKEAVGQKVKQHMQDAAKEIDEQLKQHIQQALKITTTSSQGAGHSSQYSVSEKTRYPYHFTQNEIQHTKCNPRLTQPTSSPQTLYPNLGQVNTYPHSSNSPLNPIKDTGSQWGQPQVSSTFAPSAPPASLLNRPKVSEYKKNRFSPRPNVSNKGHCCSTCSKHFGLKPIYQCIKGHSSCQDCKEQRSSCGTCGNTISNDVRNYSLEEIIAGSQVSCPNVSDGCNKTLRMTELDKHVTECFFRVMECPIATRHPCSWRGNISKLSKHVDETHPESRESVDKELRLLNIIDTSHEKSLIRLDETGFCQFLFHIKVNADERKIFMAVQMLNTKTHADLWYYEIHVFNKAEPRRKYMYVDVCYPNCTPIEEIFREHKCVSIPTSYAMSFVNEGSMTYKVFIKKDFQSESSGGGRPCGKFPTRNHMAREQ